MESADRTARAKGDAGIGEKPVCPTLGRLLVDRVRPWAAKQKTTTATWYRSGINPLLTHAIKDCRLDAITSETIADYRAHRESEGRAIGTINRELRVLRRCLRLAAEWGIITAAPKVKMAGAEVRRDRVVREQEFAGYLACAVTVARRRGDNSERDWTPPRRVPLARMAIHRLRGTIICSIRRGKTPAARRTSSAHEERACRLGETMASVRGRRLDTCSPLDTASGHIDHSTLKKQHRAAIKKSGVRSFLLYSLRHSFATKLGLAPRMDAWTLCKIMGWASIAIAMTYIHPDQQRVLDVFSGHVFGHVPKKRKGKAVLAIPQVIDNK